MILIEIGLGILFYGALCEVVKTLQKPINIEDDD